MITLSYEWRCDEFVGDEVCPATVTTTNKTVPRAWYVSRGVSEYCPEHAEAQMSRDLRSHHIDAAAAVMDVLEEVLPRVIGKSMRTIEKSGGGRVIYPSYAWADRGESFGNDALAVLVHDGGILAPFCNGAYECWDDIKALGDALEAHGLYLEQETAWASGVYRIPASVRIGKGDQ